MVGTEWFTKPAIGNTCDVVVFKYVEVEGTTHDACRLRIAGVGKAISFATCRFGRERFSPPPTVSAKNFDLAIGLYLAQETHIAPLTMSALRIIGAKAQQLLV